MSTSLATVELYVNNTCSNPITLNGFAYPFNSSFNQPVNHGNAPVVATSISGGASSVLAIQVCCPAADETQSTQGTVTWNMPNGAILQLTWNIYYHPDTNTDADPMLSIASGSGYTITDPSSGGAQVWTQSDVNTFTCTVNISES